MSVLGAVAGAIGSAALSFGGNIGGQMITQKQGEYWERRKMTHAHQWEVGDLKRAGLNPILSATGGRGATASGGGAFGQGLSRMGSDAVDAIKKSMEAQQINSATKLNEENAKLLAEKAKTEGAVRSNLIAQTSKAQWESNTIMNRMKFINEEYQKLQSDRAKAKTEAQRAEIDKELQQYKLRLNKEVERLLGDYTALGGPTAQASTKFIGEALRMILKMYLGK